MVSAPTLLLALLTASPQGAGIEPLPAEGWTLAAARHLMDRAGFGGAPDEIARLHALGPEAAVDLLLRGAAGREPAQTFDPELLRKRYREMLPAGESQKSEAGQALRKQLVREDRAQFEDYRAFWLARMVEGADPLREKLALFWHGYFTSAQREVRDSYAMAHQIELYRAIGLSSFRELLHRGSKEPAMIEYLNSGQNRKQAPNENFAREVMELFTMGPGHYGEQDIKEAARAFTGWQTRDGEFVFTRNRHDFGAKEFLGRKGDFTGEEILDILLEQDATPRFVATKLFTFFVHPEPSPEEIEPLAKLLRDADYQLEPTLRALFLSRAFYSQEAQGAQFKSPVEFVVSTLRRLEIAPPSGRFLAEACGVLGQDLLNPPNVKGWDGGESWISASTLLLRANVARVLVHGDQALAFAGQRAAPRKGQGGGKPASDAGVAIKAMREIKGWRPEIPVGDWVGDAGSARGAVTVLCDRLLPVAPDESTVSELVRYVAPFGDDAFDPSQDDTRTLLVDAIHLILCLPEYQLN